MSYYLELPSYRQAQATAAHLISSERRVCADGGGTEYRRRVRTPKQVHEIEPLPMNRVVCRIIEHPKYWDRKLRPTSVDLRSIYDAIVAYFGERCMCCSINPGMSIDHDHSSFLVRGLICHECNNRVDRCLHTVASGCHHARYLESPPALPLGLVYPTRGRRYSSTHCEVIEVLGFDPLDEATWPAEPPLWMWRAPTPPRWRGRNVPLG